MKKIAIIGGSGFASFSSRENVLFVDRHQSKLPPHKIDHKKNILFIKEQGIKEVLGVCSVGSLRSDLLPGSIMVPDDYINFENKYTLFDDEAEHVVPQISESVRELIFRSAKEFGFTLLEKGVYFQTRGPRFETKAEIRMMSRFADVVGMTMADEATLAREAGLEYAAVCMVDNYANGIEGELDTKEWKKAQEDNFGIVNDLVGGIVKANI